MPRQMFVHEFEVRAGSFGFDFPIDMLRYEGCYPARESEDAGAITDTIGRHGRNTTSTVVRLHKIGFKDWKPTDARWRSFGWMVVPGSHQQHPAN